MSNKIYNQSGIEIDAIGSPNSPIRSKTEFNLTFPKLINALNKREVLDFALEWLLYKICEKDGIPTDRINELIESAYFYENLNKTEN